MNKFLRALLKTGIYLLEQSDRAAADIRDRVKGRVEDPTDRAEQAIRAQEDDRVRNAISLAAGVALGIGIGILFAPASGEETRSSIAERFQGVGDRVRERFSSKVKKPATGTEGK